MIRAFVIAAVAILALRILGQVMDHAANRPNTLLEMAFELL